MLSNYGKSLRSQLADPRNYQPDFSAPDPSPRLPTVDELDKHLAEEYLIHFERQAWGILEPAQDLVDGWHLEAITDHLEAVLRGEILRLIINIPPRFTKSLTTSVMFPAWSWIKRPSLRFLCISYAESLSIRDSVKTRHLIQSHWYQERWADRFQLSGDQNQKIRFENDKMGQRIATSIDGVGTGEGGDGILIDDPHNIKKIESDTDRESKIQWADEVMPSRLNDPKRGFIIVIMQRSHERDLTGHFIAKNAGYEHLCLPMEYSENRVRTSIGFEDPRSEPGELLCEERFDRKATDNLKRDLGPSAYAAQYDQRPTPKKGGIIDTTKFQRYRVHPPLEAVPEGGKDPQPTGKIRLSIDTAYKPDQLNDPSVIEVWFEYHSNHYLLEVWKERVKYPALKIAVANMAAKWGKFVNEVLIEDKASGQSLIQDLREARDFPWPIIAMEPGQDSKVIRMETESPMIEGGKVYIPEEGTAAWLFDFETECVNFPRGANDDQVDAMSQYLKRIRSAHGLAVVRWA